MIGSKNGRRAGFVQTDASRLSSVRSKQTGLPSIIVKLADVLKTGTTRQKPFKYMPSAFNAREDMLMTEKKYTIIDQMRRHSVIVDAMRAKRSVLIMGWRVVPVDAKDAAAIAVANFLTSVLDGMKGGFISTLYRVTNAFDYGFSLHEQQYKVITYGEWLGMYGLQDWLYRLPHFLDFERDAETGQVYVYQRQPGGQAPKKAVASKCLWYVYKDDIDPWRGEGDLRSAYADWWLADTTEKLAMIDLESQAAGRVKVGIDVENDFRDMTDEMIAEAQKIIENWQNLFAFVEFPGLKVEPIEGRSGTSGYFLQLIEHCEQRIRQAIGKPDLMAPKSDVAGSFARAKVQKGQHYAELGKVQNDIEELIPEQCFIPLLQINGIPLDLCPSFSLSPSEPDIGIERAKQFDAGLGSGALKMREGDEDEYRQWIGARPVAELGPVIESAENGHERFQMSYGIGHSAKALARMIYGSRTSPRRISVDRAGWQVAPGDELSPGCKGSDVSKNDDSHKQQDQPAKVDATPKKPTPKGLPHCQQPDPDVKNRVPESKPASPYEEKALKKVVKTDAKVQRYVEYTSELQNESDMVKTFASDALFSKLDNLSMEKHQDISYRFAKALWSFWGKIERSFLSDSMTPAEKLAALSTLGDDINLDDVAKGFIDASKAALDLGREDATKAIPGRFASVLEPIELGLNTDDMTAGISQLAKPYPATKPYPEPEPEQATVRQADGIPDGKVLVTRVIRDQNGVPIELRKSLEDKNHG